MAKKPDSFYYDNFIACADYAVKASELLTRTMEGFEPSQIHDALDEMHKLEHSADMKHHEPSSPPSSRRSSARTSTS